MSKRNAYILSGLGLIALVAGFWFLLLSPIMDSIDETEKQIAVENQALQVARTKLAQLEEFRVQAKRNESRLLELAKMVPQEEEVPSLILQIQDLAAESGIDFLTIAPSSDAAAGPTGPAAGFQSLTLQLTMAGQFFDINDFLYRAEQMASGPGRLLRVASVALTNSQDARQGRSPKLDANIVLNAYTRVPAAAPATPAAAPAGSGSEAAPGAVQTNPTNSAG